jgi:hypothetical protein
MKRTKRALLLLATVIGTTSHTFAFDRELVDRFGAQVTEVVCSDGGAWLSCYRVEPSTCTSVVTALVQPCANEIYIPVKEPLSYEEGVKAAQRLMGCFNERFDQSYGSQKLSTPECSQPPKHLR